MGEEITNIMLTERDVGLGRGGLVWLGRQTHRDFETSSLRNLKVAGSDPAPGSL